jgi:hypothetical protein
MLYGPCIIVYTSCQTFFMLSSRYFEKKKVFVCGFVILFLCYLCFVVAAFICMFCIFMTYSTSCCCRYGLIDPWNVCTPVCKQVITLFTVLTLGIGIIFVDQLPTFHVFKRVHTVLASKCSTVSIKSQKSYE